MSKNSFLLVDLKDESSKVLAQTIQNKSCRQILDYLANNKEATESQISNALKTPISTVHYNIQALVKANLVEAEEYHYSSKGREVNHYKLANQFIIIAPQSSESLHEKLAKRLKNIIPMGIVAAGGSLVVYWLTKMQYGAIKVMDYAAESVPLAVEKTAPLITDTAVNMVPEAASAMADTAPSLINAGTPIIAEKAVETTVQVAPELISRVPDVVHGATMNPAWWFLIGAAVIIIVYFLLSLRKK